MLLLPAETEPGLKLGPRVHGDQRAGVDTQLLCPLKAVCPILEPGSKNTA